MSKLRHGYATLDRELWYSLGAVTMLSHGVRLTISCLALCVASSAGAQGNLDQSKTAAQLYASTCATCHESLASVRNTKSFLELKSFLSQHYTSNSESAANLAAYLKGQARPSVESQRRRGAMSDVRPPEPTQSASEEDIPRPPADIPEVPPPAIATSSSHVVDTGVKPQRRASSAR